MSAPRPPKTVTHARAKKPKAPVPVVAHRPPAPVAAGVASARPAAAWAGAPAAAFGIAGPVGIQRKPVIGAPDDAYEREADEVADQVTSGPAATPPRITPVTPASLRRPVQRTPRDKDADLPVQRATAGDPTHRGEEERSRSSIPAALVQRATAGDRTEHDDPEPSSAEAVQRKDRDGEKGCSCGTCSACVQRMVKPLAVQRATLPWVQRKDADDEKGCSCGSCSACVQRLVQRATAGDRTEHDDPPRASASVQPARHEPDGDHGCACGGSCARCAVQRAARNGRASAATDGDGGRFRRDGGPEMQDAAARAIARRGAGAPIVPGVRALIEARLGVDLGHVRVHTDAEAQRATGALGARAFTHGSDIWLARGESPADTRLVAHEATHVVQQGAAGPRIDAAAPSSSASARASEAHTAAPASATSTATPGATHSATSTETSNGTHASASARSSATTAASATTAGSAAGTVQRWIPQWILDELNDYAEYIPGWTLFTVIIGFNPLTGRDVPRTAHNLVRGFLGLVPFGVAIFDKLNEHGVVDDALEWVTGELGRLDLSLGRLERTVEAAWEDVSLTSGLDYNIGVLRRHFGPLYDDVVEFAGTIVHKVIDLIKQAAIGVAESLLAENRAWALIKKILGRDPLRDVQVPATPAEILADFLMLIGREEHLRQMRERGTLEETAGWLAQQFATFMGLLTSLMGLFGRAWDAIQPANIANLGTNLRSLVADAGALLQRVWDFATTVAAKVLEFVKKSLLGWLATFANDVPGFHLVTVIIGKNPFTDEPVPRTPTNLIRGFITLLPNGAAIYQRLQETGTIERVAGRIQAAMEALGISWAFVKGIFTGIWNDLSIEDLISPVDAFTRIVARYGEPVSRLFAFVNVVIREMVSIILEIMNFPRDLIGSIVANAMAAIEDVKRDPIGFFRNMLAAVKRGFGSFFDHILTHLAGGLADWLFRGLRQAGIEPPRDLSLRSVLDFVLQVLGISIERIWQKLAARIGPERVARIRGAIDRLTGIWTFVKDVQQRGVAAIWEHIESQISNLWEMVVQKARDWIMERVINRAMQWLMSLLDVTGIMPVINGFMAFFRAIQSAIDYLRDILAIVNDYVATLAAVARGDVDPGAQKIEGGLARSIPVAIGFLANQFGLGNIGEKIQEIVGGIREMVDRALDWLVDRAVATVQSLLRSLGIGGRQQPAPAAQAARAPADHGGSFSPADAQWWRTEFPFTDRMGKRHTLKFRGAEENASLVVHSEEQVVANWLVQRRETASAGLRPLVEDAMRAHARWVLNKNQMETLRAEFETLPQAQKDAREGEFRTVNALFRGALREMGRTFSALPVESEPEAITLKLPRQKPAGLYQEHMRAGRLQHSRQRPARHTNQRERWEEHVRAELPNRWMDYGRRLGLEDWQILRPNWDRRAYNIPMQVDHKIEWQVRPLGDEATLDEVWNYELLDAPSNQASGEAIAAAIEKERNDLAAATGDQSWLARDLTFNKVEGGGTAGRRWSFDDIVNGRHLTIYADRRNIEPRGRDLPEAEAVAARRGIQGATAGGVEESAGLSQAMRQLATRHPADIANLRRIVDLRAEEVSWDDVRNALGVTASRLAALRAMLSEVGLQP